MGKEERAASYTVSAADLQAEEECIKSSNEEQRLYNIAEDPSETKNVADEHPDIVEELLKKLDEYEETLVEIPHAMTLSKTAALPMNYGGHWEPGWWEGVPQANDAILMHKEGKTESAKEE